MRVEKVSTVGEAATMAMAIAVAVAVVIATVVLGLLAYVGAVPVRYVGTPALILIAALPVAALSGLFRENPR